MPRAPVAVEGQFRLFEPTTAWTPPTHLPRLERQVIAIDTETKDGGLAKELGPGWCYGPDGYLLGVSVAWKEGSIYVPVNHPETTNFSLQEVIVWCEYLLSNNRCCFFNGGYDLGWLHAHGCKVWPSRLEDASAMAVMLDENHDTYNLDTCCKRAGIQGKDEQQLNEAAAAYGIQPKNGSIKHGLWRLPARHVGPYAEQDATATLQLCHRLLPQLKAEGTEQAYRTEIALLQVVHGMRKRGIRINEDRVAQAKTKVLAMGAAILKQIPTPPAWQRTATIDDLRSPNTLAEIFDAEGIRYPRTPKMNLPSFTKDFLAIAPGTLGAQVRRARQVYDLADKFLGTYVEKYTYRGRIHAEIHQLKDESGGAKTLRFSYSNPPLQQMPSKDPELAPIVRDVFEAEEECDWAATDLKGQEPRLLTHFAYLSVEPARRMGIRIDGADRFRDHFCNDPNPDLHQFTANIIGLSRKATKDITQSLSYRAGYKKLAFVMNIPEAKAKEYWDTFHAGVPHIQGFAKYAELMANTHGYITMIDGARRHYPLWEPKYNQHEKPLPLEAAKKKWPYDKLVRAHSYQAGNSTIQGSAARQMKRAMVAVAEAGYLPMITMHDEIGNSVTSPKECKEIGELVCDAVKLVVPVTVDCEVGPTWGKATMDYRSYYREKAA